MEWKHEKKTCPDYVVSHKKASKPNAFSKVMSILRQHLRITPNNLVASFDNRDRKALEAYQLEVERLRWIAIEYSRRNTLR